MKWSISKNKNWESLEQEFVWVADMKGVIQDTIHHAEGDVSIHTQKVLGALESLSGFQKLDDQTKEIMWASALLHDVEKRSTTVVEENGRITSRGHAKKGEYTSRGILFQEVSTPFFLREKICALVRHHGFPLWIFDKSDPVKSLLSTSLRIDLQLLATLATADVLGRICGDPQSLLDRIALFEALSREQQCWGNPRKFASDLAKFVYFYKEDSAPDYVPYDDLKGEVIMLSGLPGMGKDTYLKKHYGDLPVISLDDIRRKHKLKPDDSSATGWVVQEAKEQAKVFLRKGQSFVWNSTNVTRQIRSQWIDLFVTYKARVKLIYIEVPYSEWVRQNNNREYPVPMNVLQRLLSKLEIPTPDEAHVVEYVVK